jgi:hypothetical protein
MKLAHTTHIAAYTNDPGRGQNRRRPFHPTMTRAVGPQRRSSQLIARWHICTEKQIDSNAPGRWSLQRDKSVTSPVAVGLAA